MLEYVGHINIQQIFTEKENPRFVICVQNVEFPAVVGFVDQNYCYKLVGTQISHRAMLAVIPYRG